MPKRRTLLGSERMLRQHKMHDFIGRLNSGGCASVQQHTVSWDCAKLARQRRAGALSKEKSATATTTIYNPAPNIHSKSCWFVQECTRKQLHHHLPRA